MRNIKDRVEIEKSCLETGYVYNKPLRCDLDMWGVLQVTDDFVFDWLNYDYAPYQVKTPCEKDS
jgi:hypothetical protein